MQLFCKEKLTSFPNDANNRKHGSHKKSEESKREKPLGGNIQQQRYTATTAGRRGCGMQTAMMTRAKMITMRKPDRSIPSSSPEQQTFPIFNTSIEEKHSKS